MEYVSSDCLVIPAIKITAQDKESLKKYENEFSYEFLRSLLDEKQAREQMCVIT